MKYVEYNENILEDLKEFLKISKLKYSSRKESANAVAKYWRRMKPKTEKDYAIFYNRCDDYLYENAYCHLENSCKSRMEKIVRVLKRFKLKSILEIGVGIGTYALNLEKAGYDVSVTRSKDLAFKFFKFRMKKYNSKIKIVDPNKIYDAAIFLDVIEHTYDPYSFLHWISSYANTLIFTHGFRVHNKEMGGYPQHSDHNILHIKGYLELLTYKKITMEKMIFPPHVYRSI